MNSNNSKYIVEVYSKPASADVRKLLEDDFGLLACSANGVMKVIADFYANPAETYQKLRTRFVGHFCVSDKDGVEIDLVTLLQRVKVAHDKEAIRAGEDYGGLPHLEIDVYATNHVAPHPGRVLSFQIRPRQSKKPSHL